LKRPSEHKRHILSLAGIVDAFLRGEKNSFTIFAGKASPDCPNEKRIIQLIVQVQRLTKMCVFLPNYNVSLAQKIVPSIDIAENLSTPGTEAGGTS
jgi:starch phosphorylase